MISGALCDMIVPSTKELMINIQKTYNISFTEQQVKELYELLRTEKESGCLTIDKDLLLVYNELKDTLKIGIR